MSYPSKAGRVGLKGLAAGTYDVTWFDCVTGQTAEQKGVAVAAGDVTWPRPAGIGKELAAYVRRVK